MPPSFLIPTRLQASECKRGQKKRCATGRMVICRDGQSAHAWHHGVFSPTDDLPRGIGLHAAPRLCTPANHVRTAPPVRRASQSGRAEPNQSCVMPWNDIPTEPSFHMILSNKPLCHPRAHAMHLSLCRVVPTRRVAPEMARARGGGRAGCQRRPRTSCSSRCAPSPNH